MEQPLSHQCSPKDDMKEIEIFSGQTDWQSELANGEPANEDPIYTKKILRRIDWRILPLLAGIYSFALIDRTNLGGARTAGMDIDLKLDVGNRYSVVSCIYFIPYIICQLPSNLILRKFGVRNWISFCALSWGVVQLAMGFVPTWGYLALCRVLLGAFEAGFFPAMAYLITTWYKRHEVQKRLAAFYLLSILTGGFSSLFAFALTLLNGKAGIAGWAWIFIIDGIITIFFGILAFFYIPDFPHKNTFLTADQTAFVLRRVQDDRGDAVPDELTAKKVFKHLADWKIWAYGLMFMSATMPAYAIGFFITIILRGMGFSVLLSFALSGPPYVFAAISVFFFAWLSDKYRQRAIFIAIQTIITLIGMVLTGYVQSNACRYVGLFLANAGSAGCIPAVIAYSSNNIVSYTKRAVTTAIVVSMGGVGGIFATTAFRQQDYPKYHSGILATIACQLLMLVLLAITSTYFTIQNKRNREGRLRYYLENQPGFFYTL